MVMEEIYCGKIWTKGSIGQNCLTIKSKWPMNAGDIVQVIKLEDAKKEVEMLEQNMFDNAASLGEGVDDQFVDFTKGLEMPILGVQETKAVEEEKEEDEETVDLGEMSLGDLDLGLDLF